MSVGHYWPAGIKMPENFSRAAAEPALHARTSAMFAVHASRSSTVMESKKGERALAAERPASPAPITTALEPPAAVELAPVLEHSTASEGRLAGTAQLEALGGRVPRGTVV